jgi:hypothetical protein
MFGKQGAIALMIGGVFVLAAAGCGAGSGGASARPALPAAAGDGSAATLTTARLATAQATSTPSGLSVVAYGGLAGATYTAHASGSSYDYAEDVTIDYDRALNTASFNAKFSISPTTPYSTYFVNYGKRVEITIRKTPGVSYTLTTAAGVLAGDGSGTSTAAASTFALTTPATITIPARLRGPINEPYHYGFLAHLASDSLGGSNAAKIASIIGAADAGFVRMDYTGASIMPTSTSVDFTQEDGIIALLATYNVTELPIIEQYSGAAWQNGGQPYPAIFSTPQLYAQFVKTVVAHLAATAPNVKRIELFNEPNTSGWWTSPNPAYAATDGSATAAYMLAAYAAAKAANPQIVVVGPALGDGGTETDPRTFLTNMYAAGCHTGACWDVLSVHPYAWLNPTYTVASSQSNRWQIYKDLQAIAVAHGDPLPHVMLTEWSFSTAAEPTGFDPKVQALYMALGMNLALADATVDGIVWTSVYAPGSDFWSRTSVTDASYNPLPAQNTYRSFATL